MVNPQCEHRDKFCFVCGLFTPPAHGRKINRHVEETFEEHFQMAFVGAWYKPQIICDYCRTGLQRTPPIIKYTLPMQWLPRSEHSAASCYFCINNAKTIGFRYATRHTIHYEMVDTVMQTVLRTEENEEEPVPMDYDEDDGAIAGPSTEGTAGTSGERTPPGTSASIADTESPPSAVDTSPTYEPARIDMQRIHEPILFSQSDVDNLAKELRLNDNQKERLGSRLADHNVVDENFRITAGRKRRNTQEYDEMFRIDEETNITYCWCIRTLFIRMRQYHNPAEWRLFIDGGKDSLKAVLLHITNVYPSIPIAHGPKVKETYENIDAILRLIQYKQYNWYICADLKIVAILMGLAQGYAGYQCFLCLWQGRKDDLHYDYSHKWPERNEIRIGQNSQAKDPLVRDRSKIILPPLHIKLGLVRNFTMKLDREGPGYACLLKIMTKLGVSPAKVGNGTFTGPQIRKLIQNEEFTYSLELEELEAWEALKDVIANFLGKKRADNYEQIVARLIETYKVMGVHMSLKIHFLAHHLKFFPDNLGDFSDEHGERFHQEIAFMEERYKNKGAPAHMLGSYIDLLIHSKPDM